ncbi:MAG TPA: DUF2075 domain-containing protein [Flavobacteriales bacterium]|nr:DUF2075 domain-containing protein [Flavobacteriales bacterium]
MPRRSFKLPGENDLNKDQDMVLELPEDGKFLIVGGPGTGKSVVALLRAKEFRGGDDYTFLTYNKVLNSATKQLIDVELNTNTLTSFFYKKYREIFKKNVPQTKPFNPDYKQIMKNCEEIELDALSEHLIIDEGQDMPPNFYKILKYFGLKNFFIVADQNQQLTERNSSRKEIELFLKIKTQDVIELKKNYRNSYPIALLAQHFYTDPSSPKPELPKLPKGSLSIPVLYKYKDYEKSIINILMEADRDTRKLIGVIVADDNMRNAYVDSLRSVELKLNNPRPIISSYSSRTKENVNLDFGSGGIMVLSSMSVKGLEFDIVFLIVGGFKIYNKDVDSMKKRFYVMCSRAIEKLVLLQYINYTDEMEDILPADERILIRKDLPNE